MRLKRVLAGVVSAAMVVPMLSMTSFAYDEVCIDGNTFPDFYFRSYVYNYFDLDGDGYLIGDELNATEIDLDGWSCETLEGVGVFKNLESLKCGSNKLTSLDVSELKNLKKLDCSGNDIGSLDVSKLVELKFLACSENQLKELDLSNNTSLEYLLCNDNKLEELDLSNNTNLSNVSCSNNQLSVLDVSGMTKLATLQCSNNNISVLDVNKSTELTFLKCDSNSLKSLELSNCNELYSLDCKNNQLESLNIQNTKLTSLDCSNNKLAELDVSESGVLCEYFLENHGVGYKYCPSDVKFVWDYDTCKIKSLPDGIGLGKWDGAGVDKDGNSFYYNTRTVAFVIKHQLKWKLSYKVLKDGELVHEGQVSVMDRRANYFANDDKETDNIFISGGIYTIELYDENILLSSDSIKVINEYSDVVYSPGSTENPTSTPTLSPSPTSIPTANPTSTPTEEVTKAPSVEDFAERLYTTCLGRPAEEAGKDYWTSELKGGKPGSEVAEGFFFSQEYIGKKLTDKQFIGTLYETFMGRSPAEAEVDYWASEMKSGKTRKDIFDGFVNSPEWANICLTYGIRSGGLAKPTFEKEASPEVKAFAERLYTTCLGRNAEQAGLGWWAAELANLRQTGTVAAQGFFFSPEFLGLKTSDKEYVTRLYRTFMGREPEKAGFDFWVGELKSGKSREYVFDGFSVAPEFAELCAEAGIMR